MTDIINPNHYQRDGMECIDAIEAAVQNLSGAEAYAIGSAIKYLWRWKEKGGKDDLKKAIWFIQKIVDHIEEDEYQEELKAEATLLEIARKL
jgi:DNA-binding SARP family transcriptional activator